MSDFDDDDRDTIVSPPPEAAFIDALTRSDWPEAIEEPEGETP